jgi:hypothetical protein
MDAARPGGMAGVPLVRNQVREVTIRVEAMPNGALRVSTPQARGWAVVVRTRDELVRAVQQAFTEAQVASYAQWRGESYDLDALTPVDGSCSWTAATHTRSFALRRRGDVYNPKDWVQLEDGTWRSPGGRVYGADTEVVRRVRAKRRTNGSH